LYFEGAGMVRLHDYGAFLSCIVDEYEQSDHIKAARRAPKRKLDQLLEVSTVTRKEVPGDAQVAKLLRTLDGLGYERTPTQKSFHREFLGACLQSVYGADFTRFRDRILAENGLESAHTEVLVCTPRRFGKTTSVALFCAAMLLSVDEAWISVFSTGQRASSSLLDLAHKMIIALPGGKARIAKKNQEQLFVTPPDDPTGPVRRLFSYPSSVSGACSSPARYPPAMEATGASDV
jgi:phage terminase large subunit-like protein